MLIKIQLHGGKKKEYFNIKIIRMQIKIVKFSRKERKISSDDEL